MLRITGDGRDSNERDDEELPAPVFTAFRNATSALGGE
jgi:hypothetical protein